MNYNISYDIISLIVLLIVGYRFFKLKRFPIESNLLYGYLLVIGCLNLLFDFAGSLTVRPGSNAPIWIAYLFNILYYICQIILPAALVVYLFALIENRRHVDRKWFIISLIPAALFLLIFLISMPLGLMFKIGNNHEYIYGPLSFITYACSAIYLLAMFALEIIRRKDFSRFERMSINILGILSISAMIIQFIFPNQLLVGSAVMLSFLIMYFTIQDPQRLLDSETGIFNMRALTLTMNSGYTSHKDFCIAAFKLHGLHNIYMLHGRETGDMVLKKVGAYLSRYETAECFRTGDSVFVAFFKTEADLRQFVKDFDIVRTKPVQINNVEFVPELTLICIEHAKRLNGSEEVITVIENAFENRNIESIHNKTVWLTAEDLDFYRRNIIIENELKKDLQTGENFQIYYQPIFSIKDGRFTSAEALVRYKSETLGRLRPDEFIPLAEDKGYITMLDEVVVKIVFNEIEHGTFKGMGLNNIHINLSGATFTSEKIIKKIIDLADNYEIDRSFIVFEITETAATLSGNMLVNCAMMIRDAGFGLALDDFGVGYANIKRLLDMPFSHIKLDKCLAEEASVFIGEITNLFRHFNMSIIAEGVETEEQLSAISEAGVDMIQGFYYARPMPIEDFSELLKGNTN